MPQNRTFTRVMSENVRLYECDADSNVTLGSVTSVSPARGKLERRVQNLVVIRQGHKIMFCEVLSRLP